jgi:signal transduction histidine kinase
VRFRNLSLGIKLNIALLVFLLVLGVATSAIVFYGFNRTKDNASDRSRDALEEEGRLALEAFAGGIADSGALQLEYAAEVGQRASRYLRDFQATDATASYDVSRLVRAESGLWYDPEPDRVSDVVAVSPPPELDEGVIDDIMYSAPLDALFPALAQGFPGQLSGDAFRPFAIIFVGINGVGRYYPPIGIQESTPTDVDFSDFYDRFGPVVNPERESLWTPPYEDVQGRGLVITAQTPIYDHTDRFRGIFEVDISIAALVDQVDVLKPTTNGFTFYIDTEGEIMRTGAYDLLTSEAEGNEAFAAVLESMKTSAAGTPITTDKVPLDGDEYFISHSPMSPIGGSIGVAAPVDEVTAQAATITAGIDDNANRTLWIMLGVMAALFVAGMVGAGLLNRRVLVSPIQRLVAATETVAGGDLETNAVVDREDELGALAGSFNVMVEKLRESERHLERRVEERTRELEALLEVSRQIAAEVAMADLAETLVRVAGELFESTAVSVSAYNEEGTAVHLASSNPALAEEGVPPGTTYDISRQTPIWEQLKQGKGLLIDDVRGESELAAAYRVVVGDALDGVFRNVRSWMAAPLEVNDRVIGSMIVTHSEPDRYTDNDLKVATAMASQAAVALENARLFDESKLRAQELDALLRADAELFRSLNLDEVLQALVDVAVDVLGVDKSMVSIWDEDRGQAKVRAYRNLEAEVIARIQEALPRRGRSLANDYEPIFATVDSGVVEESVMQWMAATAGIQAFTDIPIKSPAGKVLGGFGVSYTEPHDFSEEEKRVLIALAERAAVAISNAELYERAQDAASLEERQRLARELHDSVSQALYGIALGARTAREQLDRDPGKAAEPVDYVLALAEAGLAEMRALIFELRPESLATEGLVAAIEKQVAATQARFGIEVESDLCSEPDISIDKKEAYYRIAQEALHNVVKHAKAQHAWVSLAQADGALTLEVRDDGVGFDPETDYAGHLGLKSMRERAGTIGASVTFESAPGAGSRVRLRTVPTA